MFARPAMFKNLKQQTIENNSGRFRTEAFLGSQVETILKADTKLL